MCNKRDAATDSIEVQEVFEGRMEGGGSTGGVLSNLSDLDVVVLSQSDLLYQSDS